MNERLAAALANDATPRPPSVRLAFRAAVVWAVFTALSGIVLIGGRSYLYDSLIRTNTKLAADDKNKKLDYVGSVVDHDVSRVITGGIITGVLSAIIIVLLAIMVLRARSVGRWALIAMATVLTYIVPFGTGVLVQLIGPFVIDGAPIWYRAVVLVAGLACLVVLILLLLPETSRFFAENRPERARAKRPSLFSGLSATRTAMKSTTNARPSPREQRETARQAKLARAAGTAVSGDVVDVEPSGPVRDQTAPDAAAAVNSEVNAASARPRGRSQTTTRPGSVKPKGASTGRAGRAKSRNQ